jgi:hypothetical protein
LAAKLSKATHQLTQDEEDQALKTACEEFKACAFIKKLKEKNYGDLKKELDNLYLFNRDAYPGTNKDAYRYAQNYQSLNGGRPRGPGKPSGDGGGDGLAFFQGSNKACHSCGGQHLLKDCPDLTDEEKRKIYAAVKAGTHKKQAQVHANVGAETNDDVQECLEGVANIGVSLADADIESLDGGDGAMFEEMIGLLLPTDHWTNSKKVNCGRNKIFLDSCATNHTMFATEHLTGCHATKTFLRQDCNAGTWKGIKFWINADGIANLLSIPQLEKSGCSIRYKTGNKWQVFTPGGKVVTFEKDVGVCGGMPFIDVSRDPTTYIHDVAESDGFVGVQTVRGNMEGFTAEQVLRAAEARDGMAMMAHPPIGKLTHVVSSTNLISNIPFGKADLTNSVAIFGKDQGAIRGKTVRQRPSRVRPEFVTIPQELYERVHDVVLAADVMFVNGLPFFVSLSRGIKLLTVEFTPSRTIDQLSSKLKKVIYVYRRAGFRVRCVLMDMEFEKLVDSFDEGLINTTAAREHVGDIERAIRFIEERARSVLSEVPFKHCMPDAFVIHLMMFVVFWINAFPSDSGVLNIHSPREIVTGLKVDFKKHCRARWGGFVCRG